MLTTFLDVPRSTRNLPGTFTVHVPPSGRMSKQASRLHRRTDHDGPDRDERSAHVDVPRRSPGPSPVTPLARLMVGGLSIRRSRGCLNFTGNGPGERFSSCAA